MADSATWRNILSVEDFRKLSNVGSLISIALQSQYSHSERYRQLGLLFNAELDASPQLDAFFNFILNPDTASGVWLDWWGKRVGVNRNLVVDGQDTRLDDEFFRFLIFYRAVVNVSNSTAEDPMTEDSEELFLLYAAWLHLVNHPGCNSRNSFDGDGSS